MRVQVSFVSPQALFALATASPEAKQYANLPFTQVNIPKNASFQRAMQMICSSLSINEDANLFGIDPKSFKESITEFNFENLTEGMDLYVSNVPATAAYLTEYVHKLCAQLVMRSADSNPVDLISSAAIALNASMMSNKDAKADATDPVIKNLKLVMFFVNKKLAVDLFAEDFISLGGMDYLITITKRVDGNLAALAIKGLMQTMTFLNGLDYIEKNPESLYGIYELSYNTKQVTVCKQVLLLLLVLAELLANGTELIINAAEKCSEEKGTIIFSNLVDLLNSGDLDATINALAIINSILRSKKQKKEMAAIIKRLEEAKFFEVIEKLNIIHQEDFISQLEIFASLTQTLLPQGYYDVEKMSRRLKSLEDLCNEQKIALEEFKRNEKLASVIKEEFNRLQEAVIDAYESGFLISSEGPQQRIKSNATNQTKSQSIEALFKKLKQLEEIDRLQIELSNLSQEKQSLHDSIEQYKDYVNQLRERIKEVSPLKNEVAQLQKENRNLDLQIQNLNAKLKNEREMNEAMSFQLEQLKKDLAEAQVEMRRSLDSTSAKSVPAQSIANYAEKMSKVLERIHSSDLKLVKSEGSSEEKLGNQQDNFLAAIPSAQTPLPPPLLPAAPPIFKSPKKDIIPKKKMKGLYWQRVIVDSLSKEASHNSVWNNLPQVSFDSTELEELFSISAPEKKKTEQNDDSKSQNSKKRILQPRRSNAIGVMMAKLPSVDRIRKEIISSNSVLFNRDTLESIFKNLATAEEIQQIEASGLSFGNLDKPEQLLLTLDSIPDIRSRLQCLILYCSFEQELDELLKPFETMSKACEEIMDSNNLKLLIALVLNVGNYLNGGTPRGRAEGFDISILTRLDDLRSNQKSSLLHFIASAAHSMDTNFDAHSLKLEMSSLNEASALGNLSEYDASASKFQLQFHSLESIAAKVERIQGEEDNFPDLMKSFFDNYSLKNDLLSARMSKCSKNFKALVSYFGCHEYDQNTSKGLFTILKNFIEKISLHFPNANSMKEGSHSFRSKLKDMQLNRKHKVGEKIASGANAFDVVVESLKKGKGKSLKTGVSSVVVVEVDNEENDQKNQ